LDHPSICTVHEIDETKDGQLFIAMAYYEGESLKKKIEHEPLKLEEAVDIAVHIAQGLAKAHSQGIVHRDIKPANIFITEDGQVKILDFGLAKSAHAMSEETGKAVGTLAYMSPEQLSSGEIDHRTDIWSLGVVLYEMLTGQLPFKGEYNQAMVYSILNEEPKPVAELRIGVPMELEFVVKKALVKRLEERYQDIADILFNLRKVRKELEFVVSPEHPYARKPRPSIAVLPFTDLSPDKDQEYFCDGMAEELINALTHIEGLHVVARTSAFAFKGRHEDIREIGKKLDVGTVLEGSVRKAGNRLRITAQFVNVADGYHLWSEKYDRDIGELCCPEDIFAIQDEISLAIVNKLKVKLLGAEKEELIKRHTEDLEAYNLYLKGRYSWNKRTEESLNKGIEYFQQAIEQDPSYALAYAGLADSYITLPDYSSISPKEIYPKANEAVRKALEIDGALAEAHTSLAMIMSRSWDFDAAEREYKRALELNPHYATAHHWYALHLMYMARFDEAIEEMNQAHELDPLSLVIHRNTALVLYYARRYDQALEVLKRTLEIDPCFSTTHTRLGEVYLQKSMYEEALVEFRKEKDITGAQNPLTEALNGITYERLGRRREAKEALDNLLEQAKQGYIPPILLANFYFALDENDEGFKWLDKAYEEGDSTLLEIKVDPGFDSVRSDPRFLLLLKKIGLEK